MNGSVIIEQDGAGLRVRLDPPDAAWPDRAFTDARMARGYAGGVRLATGRRKVDLLGA